MNSVSKKHTESAASSSPVVYAWKKQTAHLLVSQDNPSHDIPAHSSQIKKKTGGRARTHSKWKKGHGGLYLVNAHREKYFTSPKIQTPR